MFDGRPRARPASFDELADQELHANEGEMVDSSDQAIQDNREQAFAVTADVEAGSSPSNLPVENGSSTESKESKLKKDLKVSLLLNNDLKLALFLLTISAVPLIDTLFLRGSASKLPLKLKFSAFFAFTAFVTAICLMFHILKLMTIKPEHLIPINQLKGSKVLLTICVTFLILTSISITYSLLPKAYYFLPIALLPSILVVVFHYIFRVKFNRDVRSEESKALKKALKSSTQLTLSLVTTSFSGFIGDLIGVYHKAESLGDQYSHVKVSIFLMLGGGLAGILALLLCKLLSSSNDDDHRRTWQRAILATANAAMLAMLVPSLLMIAETILHGLLVAAVFPAVAGALAWAFLNFCTAAGAAEEDDGKAEQGTMYAIAVAVASVSFGAILAVFAGLLGGTVGKGQLKVCTFFMASAFVAATSLGVVTSVAAPARKASVTFAAAVLACCGLGSLVLAALALFYQIGGVGP
ncbi:hypothetical protein ABZP36_020950 [Zizania latifolia]